MADEINYVHEDATPNPAPKFFSQRWVKITGIALIAAVALVGAFGAGVVAGERIGGNQSLGGDRGFGQQFGGGTQQFGGGMPGGAQNGFQGAGITGDARGFGPHGFPGGCPADDPDHCAGLDRGQHGFQLPNNSGGATSGTTTGSGTSNP